MIVNDITKEVVTAAPATSVVAANVFGVPLQSWVLILSAILILCQLFWLFYNNIVRKKDGPTEDPAESTDKPSASK